MKMFRCLTVLGTSTTYGGGKFVAVANNGTYACYVLYRSALLGLLQVAPSGA